MRLHTLLIGLPLLLATTFSINAQTIKPMNVQKGLPEKLYDLNYRGTTLDQTLEVVRKITGRTIIMDPKVSPITINLVSEEKLKETDVLIAIETYLELNNIVMIPQGENFLQVVPADAAFQRPLKPNYGEPDLDDPNDESRIVSQVVTLKYVSVDEVQPIFQLMLHSFAKVQYLERANSILLVDSAYNIKRVTDVLKFIDRPNIRSEEPKIYEIKYAQATEVAAKLTELIAESQAEEQSRNTRTTATLRTTTPTTQNRTTPPGVIRARTTPQTPASTSATMNLASSDAEKGLITGKVQIVPDERTNIIIIISRPENFPFFDQMIEVLDIKVEPEITFKNIRLEFAIAEDIAALINELIGAASADTSRTSSGTPGTTPGRTNGNQPAGSTQARSISDFIRSRNASTSNSRNASTSARPASDGEGDLGEISESTQVIADPRTNSIMIMGRKADIELLTEVVKEVDIMLDQVLIEAVILEVGLNNNISYGVDWLQRSLTVVDQQQSGPRGGITTSDDIAAFGSASRQGGSSFIDGATVDRNTDFADGALSIFGTYYDLNLDVVVSLAAGDSDARVLSTPVILTTDNTEANIIVGERRPIPTSTSQGINTGINQTNVDYENIGIELKVTPRINPQGFVVMEIEQSADNVGGNVVISGDEFPIITTRQLQGAIAVQDRQTIVLGGLVSEDTRDSTTKVPLIGDMPLVGTFFRSKSNQKNRTELLVLITPYVVGNSIEALAETKRLKGATKLSDESWHRQWSDSPLNPDKNAHTPISRFRDRIRGDQESAATEATPTFAPVEPNSAHQVKETSRFQRPLLQRLFGDEDENKPAVETNSGETPAFEPAPAKLKLKPTPGSTNETGSTTEIPVENPIPAPKAKISTPDLSSPDNAEPATPTAKSAAPGIAAPTPAPIGTPAEPSPPPALNTPATPPAIPALTPTPRPTRALPPPVQPASLPEKTAVPAPAIPPSPAIATKPNVVPKKTSIRNVTPPPSIKATPAPRIENNPAVKLVTPPSTPNTDLAPIRALKHQSGQKLILNGQNTNQGSRKSDKDVGDSVPEKDTTSQKNRSSGLRGLFSALR